MTNIAQGLTAENVISKATPIFVRGKLVNKTMVQAFARRLNSVDEVVTQWANAAVLELTLNRNPNWLSTMFKCEAFQLANGGLNKLGTDVYQYVQAHFPRVIYDKETQVVGVKKFNPDSPLADKFVAVGHTAENVDLGIVEVNGKFYAPQGDFLLTFAEYKAFKAASAPKSDDDDVKPVQAKAFAKAAEKALEAQKVAKFIGSPDELVTALEAIGKLADGIRAQIAGADKAAIDSALDILAAAEKAKKENAARAINVVDMSDDDLAKLLAERKRLAAAVHTKPLDIAAADAKAPKASKAKQLKEAV